MVGKTLGSYKITGQLGKGGMGEVYLAEDPRLKREIALKLLPSEMAADPERRARFEREAQAIAALNHPNIVTIHSVEDAEGLHFITMELVRGQTLTEAIPQNGLALNKLFEYGVPFADAIAAAHEQGVTHRDLKPDNVMIGGDGRLKVLDFGLAKLRDESTAATGGTQMPTASITSEGRIMGTAAYMAPEQAEGKPVDPRSDVFALGIVLYEMATGQRPFEGETSISVVSSILRETPRSVTDLNSSLPRHLGRIIKRCLAKDPSRRYQSAVEVRNELEELKSEIDSGELSAESVPTVAPKTRPGAATIAVAILGASALLIAGFYLARWIRPAPEAQRVAPVSEFTKLTERPGEELFPSFSPDARSFIYMSRADGDWDIYLQRVGGKNPINLTEDSVADDGPGELSPDGDLIVFRSERDGGGIFLMGATGESVRRLTDFGFNPSWSADGTAVVIADELVRTTPDSRGSVSLLWRIEIASGERKQLTQQDAVQPRWSPNGQRIAFWGVEVGGGQRDLWTVPAAGGQPRHVTSDAALDWSPVWAADGRHLFFSSDRGGHMNLWRVAIDEASGAVLGTPEPVTTGVSAAAQHASVSSDGSHLVYTARVTNKNLHRLEIDPITGKAHGAPIPITRGSTPFGWPSPSPDGEWLACGAVGRQEDIFIMRADGSDRRQLTDDPHKDRLPTWAPDGERIVFYSDRGGSYDVWSINSDGSDLRPVTEFADHDALFPNLSPDGSRMTYSFVMERRSFVRSFEGAEDDRELPVPPEGSHIEPMDWSANGRGLVGPVFSEESRTSLGVWLLDLDGGSYRRLTEFGWSPRWVGDNVVFWDRERLFFVDVASKRSHEILDLAPHGIDVFIGASDSGRSIYFTLLAAESDIWQIALN